MASAMAEDLRKTGIRIVGDIPWGIHLCQFYETKEDLFDILIPYFKTGLENNEFCLWVVSNSEILSLEDAKRALEQAVPDLDRHLSDKNIEILNGLDWYLEESTFNLKRVISAWDAKLKQALALGYDGMRVSGDTYWLGERDWRKDFHTYEEEVDDFTTDRTIIALCTYPLAKSGAAEILDVGKNHQFAIVRRQGDWVVIETPDAIQANAEIKRLNEEMQRVMARTPKPPLILSYGVAVLSVTAALIIALWMRMELGLESTPIVSLFLCAVMFSAWFGGVGAGLLAYALSLLVFVYCFITPIYSLSVDIKEIPRLVVFTLSALFVGLLSAAQRSAAESLGRARDVLEGTVQELKQTNESLQAKNAERQRAEQQLKNSNEKLRALSASLQSAREEEGTRIAREIHDELGSALASLKWDLEEMDKIFSDSKNQSQLSVLRKKTEAMMALTDTTISTIRRIASELRPSILDDLGLAEAIEWQAQQFQERTGIICFCDCSLENVDFNNEQSTAVFRIFQEALTNILRHAQATRIDIELKEKAGELILTISDNGRGFTEDEKTRQFSFGILGMRERAQLIGGKVFITGVEGKGTVVTVQVPISR
jgi:signal transduction histidine kinase